MTNDKEEQKCGLTIVLDNNCGKISVLSSAKGGDNKKLFEKRIRE